MFFGLEVEANLIGQNGQLLMQLHKKVNHPNLHLIFDGGNLASQNLTSVETIEQYRAMKAGIGWMHIKDYKIDPTLEWEGHVDEERLKNFVPADRGDSGHEEILRDFGGVSMEQAEKGRHSRRVSRSRTASKGGGQFGGVSGVDGFGVALRALLNVLDYVGMATRPTMTTSLRKGLSRKCGHYSLGAGTGDGCVPSVPLNGLSSPQSPCRQLGMALFKGGLLRSSITSKSTPRIKPGMLPA